MLRYNAYSTVSINFSFQIIISDFAVNENMCHATELSKSAESMNEFRHWVDILLEDSVSLGIRDVETNQLVSVCLNKILVNNFHITKVTKTKTNLIPVQRRKQAPGEDL